MSRIGPLGAALLLAALAFAAFVGYLIYNGGIDNNSSLPASVQTTPTPQPTANGGSGNGTSTPTPGGSNGKGSATNFNPYPFSSQSCGPEINTLGGCKWDIGTMGNFSDPQGRSATQVGIVKGVNISWNGKTADSSSNGRCSLVVLTPNGFFENLNVKDANVTVYNVSTTDIAGWTKTLAVQAAYEQQKDYGCPAKSYDQINQWGSSIQSPPCGTPGFNNCGDPKNQTTPPATTPTAVATPCATVNCEARRTSADSGGSASFTSGEAVYGYTITIGGTSYNNCYFQSAPGDGTVTDGVVNYWPAEVAKTNACS